MKIAKLLVRLFGIGFLVGGLVYFSNVFHVGGVTKNIAALFLRFTNAFVWIVSGYGLIRLKKWSLYGLGAIIVLSLIISFFNLYFSKAPKEAFDLTDTAVHVVIFFSS